MRLCPKKWSLNYQNALWWRSEDTADDESNALIVSSILLDELSLHSDDEEQGNLFWFRRWHIFGNKEPERNENTNTGVLRFYDEDDDYENLYDNLFDDHSANHSFYNSFNF